MAHHHLRSFGACASILPVINLRSYQTKAVEDVRTAYAQGRRAPLLVAPCGAGKTTIFSYIAQGSQAKGKRSYILVHREELIRQVSETLRRFAVPHGFIASGYSESSALTQICSVQTLVHRLHRVPVPDLIISDEAHHGLAKTWLKIFGHWPAARILGVTATPCRANGAGLGVASGGVYDCLIRGPEVHELIRDGYLCQPVYYGPPSPIDLADVHTVRGDFNVAELELAVDKPKITGSAVDHYTKICAGRPAIAFCTSRVHAEHVRAEFIAYGYAAEIIDGKTDDKVRAERVAQIQDGRLQVLVTIDLVSEGFDAPGIHCGINLRPTESLGLYIQQGGRPIRMAPGKQRAIILDHAGNCLRHGLIEEVREWSLDGDGPKKRGQPTDKVFTNRQCPKCYMVSAPRLSCPGCGHVYEINSREVAQVSGELTELTGADIEAHRALRNRIELAHAESRDELLKIAKIRGHKPAWVDMIIRGRAQKDLEKRAAESKQGRLAV